MQLADKTQFEPRYVVGDKPASLPPEVLVATGLKRSYGKLEAVREATIRVREGDFLTLLGPSGSGKSTLLMMIAGFVNPDAGQLSLRGRSLIGLSPQDRNIGVVFQDYALFPHMTVGKNVGFPLWVRGVKRADRDARVAEILETVGLSAKVDRFPRELSGGEQQRVAIARALVFEPGVLLMDEPLGALDKRLRDHMQLEIKRLQRKLGLTIIYVTHDQDEAMSMSDQVAVMRRGTIEQIGSPSEIYERPTSLFVANFMGESSSLKGTFLERGNQFASIRLTDECEISGVCFDDTVTAGDVITATIRPEYVSLISGEQGPSGSVPSRNMLKGRVVERTYLGDQWRIQIKTPAGIIRMAQHPGSEQLPSLNEVVTVEWEQARTILYANDTTVI